MSFTDEFYTLLITYTKDIEDKDITREDLLKIPYWRCVWGYWRAQAHYNLNHSYKSLEDVPEGLESYSVIGEDVRTSYFTMNGKLASQSVTKVECRKIYGD